MNSRIAVLVGLNSLSSICAVYFTKQAFSDYGFPFGVSVTAIQFIGTFIGIVFCWGLGVFKFKRLPVLKILPLCGTFCGFAALTNLSLVHNSVVFFQLMKILTIPILVLVEEVFFGKHQTRRVYIALALIVVGVTMGASADSEANFLGTLVAVSSVGIGVLHHFLTGSKQKELGCDSFQMLLYLAPISALVLCPVAFFADDMVNNYYFPCQDAVGIIYISALLSFVVHVTLFALLAKTPPDIYASLGQFELVAVLIMGYTLFDTVSTMMGLAGTVLAVAGVLVYSHSKLLERSRKAGLNTMSRTPYTFQGGFGRGPLSSVAEWKDAL